MRTGAHSPVGNAPNCRGFVSTTNRRDTNAHLRPNGSHSSITHQRIEGTLESIPAAVRSVKCPRATKASSQTVEFTDGRNVRSVS
eukprot:5454808-Prymnesium_polylepis.1